MATESTEEHGKIKPIKVKKQIMNKMRSRQLKKPFCHGRTRKYTEEKIRTRLMATESTEELGKIKSTKKSRLSEQAIR